MTHDHVEDFIETMRREGVPFLVMVPVGNKYRDETAYRISSFTYDDGPGSIDDMIAHLKTYKKHLESDD